MTYHYPLEDRWIVPYLGLGPADNDINKLWGDFKKLRPGISPAEFLALPMFDAWLQGVGGKRQTYEEWEAETKSVMQPVAPREVPATLTPEERDIIRLLAAAYNGFIHLPVIFFDDQADFSRIINQLQSLVYARVGMRSAGFYFPDRNSDPLTEADWKKWIAEHPVKFGDDVAPGHLHYDVRSDPDPHDPNSGIYTVIAYLHSPDDCVELEVYFGATLYDGLDGRRKAYARAAQLIEDQKKEEGQDV